MRTKIEQIIKPDQYVYQPKVSTTDAFFQYLNDLSGMLDQEYVKFVQSACLNFFKAFDRLQPPEVLDKMKSYDNNVIKLVKVLFHSIGLSDRLGPNAVCV